MGEGSFLIGISFSWLHDMEEIVSSDFLRVQQLRVRREDLFYCEALRDLRKQTQLKRLSFEFRLGGGYFSGWTLLARVLISVLKMSSLILDILTRSQLFLLLALSSISALRCRWERMKGLVLLGWMMMFSKRSLNLLLGFNRLSMNDLAWMMWSGRSSGWMSFTGRCRMLLFLGLLGRIIWVKKLLLRLGWPCM